LAPEPFFRPFQRTVAGLYSQVRYTTYVKKLIINADDFGDAPFTHGILEAHAKGPLTSATVLVNTEGAKEAITKAAIQGLPLGLHLNFTHGMPLTGTSSLVSEGRFLEKFLFVQALEEGRIDSEDIAREAEAQLNWFIEHAGIPTHVDGHHHVHIQKQVLDALVSLAAKKDVTRMRIPYGLPGAEEAKAVCDSSGIRTNDHFIGLDLGWQNCTIEKVEDALRSLTEGVSEYMVHLAHPEDIPEGTETIGRTQEFTTLMHPQIIEVLQEECIECISYSDI
jgi:predicted glycoside hydrolase/deacetylase ChbG (UPF0249 family)